MSADRSVVIIKRRGAKDVALISADELSSITETAPLLRSPRNAARLQKAMKRARKRSPKPQPVAKLLKEMKLDREN